MTKGKKQKAIFIDRDGTLIYDRHFIRDPQEVEFIPGSIEALKIFLKLGYKIIIVSNQSGVARGYFTEADVNIINCRVQELAEPEGITIAAFYYCPHHPDGIIKEYRKVCDCRKPEPGLLYKAMENFGLDLAQCIVIGDKDSDIGLARRVGAIAIRVKTGKGGQLSPDDIKPDYRARDLLDAARWIDSGRHRK
ncbi:HAD family hydrolase [bacterium]|nr:HAD family hydrolase [bacterium]